MTAGPDERRAVLALCLVQLVDVLGVTVTVTALPMMLRDVHARAAQGSLVATGYALFFGGLLMFGARLGDRLGHRRVVLASLVGYALGALLAVVATDVVVLTVARCVQGAAAATAVPSALHLLTVVVPPERRARAVAAWSAAGAVAGAAGFVVGGAVGAVAGWRPVFAGFVVVAALLAVAVRRWVPTTGPPGERVPLHPWGSVLVTAAVMTAVLGTTLVVEPTRRWVGVALLVAAPLLVAVFVVVDRRAELPLVPGRVVGRGSVRRGLLASFVNTATTSATATLVTLHLQDTLGLSPLVAAGVLLPFSLAVVAGSAVAGRALARASPDRVAATGLGAVALGTVLLLLVPDGAIAAAVLVGGCFVVAGAGLGLSAVAATSLATDVEEDVRAAASGLVNTAAQLGTALGIAVLLLAAASTTGVPAEGTDPPRVAWAVAAALAAATACVLARVPARVARG